MLFNSIEFLIFLPIVFCLYWFLFQKSLKIQNLLLLVSSYVFYGWWDYRFLSLIVFSTVVDYFVGLKIHSNNDKKLKKYYLWISIFFNLGLLGFFKYFNFFIDSWIDLLSTIGYQQKSTWTLNIILPVGISFYTFQTMSYSLDIYYGKLKPTKDFISFASFVSFFPQLVAGPIERASNLLPQILNNRIFKYEQGVQGLRLILYGMFKKVVIADSLGPIVDIIFQNYTSFDGGVLLLALIYFSFQIYCDFSGYSDIAIGTSKLFGFELMSNFKYPYFSSNPNQFWDRWHISLTSWLRDYIYNPLALNIIRKGNSFFYLNVALVITWFFTGLWHGANYTFIAWGMYWCLILLIYKYIKSPNKVRTKLMSLVNIFFMNLIVMFSWIFFRSETILDAFNFLVGIVTRISMPGGKIGGLLFIFLIIIFDWIFKSNERQVIKLVLFKNYKINKIINVIICYFLFFMIMQFYNHNNSFIYFQF